LPGVVEASGEFVGEVRHGVRLRQPGHGGLVPPGRPGRVAGHVQRDAKEPRQQGAAFGSYGGAQAPCLEEGERDDLFGGRPVAGQAEGVVVDRAGMVGEEQAELVVVSGAQPGALTVVHALPCPVRVGEFLSLSIFIPNEFGSRLVHRLSPGRYRPSVAALRCRMDHDGMDRSVRLDRGGARWIEELPAGLAAQQGLLRGLRAFSQADPDVRWLAVGCSLARDAGDWLSDIDGAVGVDLGADADVEAERFAEVFPRVRSAVDGLGQLVDSYHHKLPGLTLTHERIFAQYADRSQLDLVVYPSTVFAGSIPNVVVLYDPDSVLDVLSGWIPLRCQLTWASTCGVAPPGRRWSGCTRPGPRSGSCGPPSGACLSRSTG
jgi:hypothetical protein